MVGDRRGVAGHRAAGIDPTVSRAIVLPSISALTAHAGALTISTHAIPYTVGAWRSTEMADGAGEPLERLRAICLALPEVSERPSHGAPAWFVRDRRPFVHLWPDGHHQQDFPHLWCAAPPGLQEELIAADPNLFFRPPYVGHRGWLGMRLDGDPDWNEIAVLCRDAYRVVAPVTLVRALDAGA
jgi:hypothetical protein